MDDKRRSWSSPVNRREAAGGTDQIVACQTALIGSVATRAIAKAIMRE